jgi:glycosyltransferase involved in cell wall biosynthesis
LVSHVAFYEPPFSEKASDIWRIRGGSKYKSILGDLRNHAKISILMSQTPPKDDPHRQELESDYGVSFVPFSTSDITQLEFADELAENLIQIIHEIRPTILSNLNGRSVGHCYALALAARATNIEYVLRVAGNDIESRAKVAEMNRRPFLGTPSFIEAIQRERIAVHLANRIIVMTKREKSRVGSFCEEPDKIQVCFRGADQSHFRPRQPADKCRRFLFVGRQSFEKGYDILEEATLKLASAYPDATVTFAGTFDPGEKGICRYAGFVRYPDLPKLYQQHDALVICSRSEGFPQVIMEAMSSGLPCILTRDIFRMDFEDDVHCILTNAKVDDVAAAMIRLCRDEDVYRKLARHAVEFAKQKFSENENRKLYRSILLGQPNLA